MNAHIPSGMEPSCSTQPITRAPVPVHVLIGMGGADNSYMPGWIEPPPPWVAHRDSEMTFGHARITLLSESVLHFEYAAVDGAIHDEFFLSKDRTAFR